MVPDPVQLAPASPRCLAEPPPAIDQVVIELARLPKDAVGTRAQLDRLALAYERAWTYAQRAWRSCGGSGS